MTDTRTDRRVDRPGGQEHPDHDPRPAPTADELTEQLRATMPLCASLGIAAERMDADAVVLRLDWRPELCTAGGLLHGGALMALADSAGAACAFAHLPAGALGTVTVGSTTNLLGAVRGGAVTATSRALHVGSSTIVVQTDLRADGRLVATTTQTQLVRRAGPTG